MTHETLEHRRLSNGIELACSPLPDRPVVAIEMRLFAGYVFEDPQHLGVTHVLDEVLTKGTAQRDGRALNDAFDEIGVTHDSYAGRETVGFSCLCLPEFVERTIALHAEFLRTPSFPPEACTVAVDLSRQALSSLTDDPGELAKKLLHREVYGEPLGRHVLGEDQTLTRIDREAIRAHWQRFLRADRMQVSVAGAINPPQIADLLETHFADFAGAPAPSTAPPELRDERGRPDIQLAFNPKRVHEDQPYEQSHVVMCFPGTAVRSEDYPAQRVLLGILAGGMSGRLITELREKRGLVYWAGAWCDNPRQSGVIHLGASTTPQRVQQTFDMLLQEINRLGEDLTEAELQRAIAGIVTRAETQGDMTRSRAAQMADDLFFRGEPLPLAAKLDRIRAVTVADILRFLESHPRDSVGVVTVGRNALQ